MTSTFRFFVLPVLLAGLLAVQPVAATVAVSTQGAALQMHSAPLLRHYGAAEGLPQVSVNTMLRTQDGFLWLGTFSGLVRFDGKEFRTFVADGSNSGTPSRRIVSLHEDEKLRLWIGTEDAGVGFYQDGRFRHQPICGGTCQVHRVLSIDARHLLALTSRGIFRISADSLQVERLAAASGGYSQGAHIGKQMMIAGLRGLARVSGDDIVPIPLPGRHKQVYSMAGDGDLLWMIVDGGNLYRHDVADGRWTWIRGDLPLQTHVLSDGAGGIHLSDDIDGIRQLARDGRETPLEGAQRLFAISLMTDAAGALWIGTPGKGLWQMRPAGVDLLRSLAVPDAPGRVVAPDGKGGMWLAMSCMSLWHLDAEGRQVAWPIKMNGGEGCIHGLLHDAATGVLWIGTSGGVLARLADGRIERVIVSAQADQVGIWKLRDGSFWTAGLLGIGRLRFLRDGRVDVVGQVPELVGMEVKQVRDARAGGVWVVGDRGAFRVVDATVVERWTPAQGIRGRFFRALHEDVDGVLWIGSYGNGLIRIERGVVRQYTEADGLFDDTVSCILPASDGHLWLAGNRGIGLLLNPRIGEEGPLMRTLTAEDGLDPVELNGSTVPPCADDGAGHLWFAMMTGFARVPSMQPPSQAERHAPVAYIDHVAVSQRVVDIAGTVELDAHAANLQINYGAIDLFKTGMVRFRYRLTGNTTRYGGWVDAGENRSVLLPDIPWGRLAFEVQARESGGLWSPSATLHLNRPQPWYKRQWIWMAASLASLLALLWLTREPSEADEDAVLLARLRKHDAEGVDSRG